jgi:hypothetical protein
MRLNALICLLALGSCRQLDVPEKAPECIDRKIADFLPETCEEGASVKEYLFRNRKVYVFDRGNCGADMTSEVADDQCKTLGHLGGITGNTQIEGEEFSSATLVRTVWSN